MANITENNWKEQLDFSSHSKAITFVNTSCNNAVIDSRSSLYTREHKTEIGNDQYNIQLIGKDIVLKKGDDRFDRLVSPIPHISLNTQVSLQNLIIACDVLEIHDELIVPECNVSIFARKVIFKSGGCINTSPLPWDIDHAPNATRKSSESNEERNGANGRDAGNINLFVRDLEIEDESNPIIKANGGNGQDAGEGLNGEDGKCVKSFKEKDFEVEVPGKVYGMNTITHHATFDPPAISIKYEWYELTHKWASWKYEGNEKDVPTNGTNAKQPGKPGEPGDAGNISCNISIPSLYEFKGGDAGKKRLMYMAERQELRQNQLITNYT